MSFVKKHPIIANLLVAVLVLFLLIWLTLRWLDSYTRHDKSVEIPVGIVGATVEDARATLESKKLHLQVDDTIYLKSAKPGTIHSITPPEGNRVKEDRMISATIYSKNPPMIVIPDVVDMSQRQALALIRSVGFENVEVKKVDGAYRDLVVGLEVKGNAIQSGERYYNNTPLTLLVSTGSAMSSPGNFSLNTDSVIIETTPDESWF